MQGGHNYFNEQQNQRAVYRDSWRWLKEHGLPGGKTGGNPTEVLCDIFTRKKSTMHEPKTKESCPNIKSQPQI